MATVTVTGLASLDLSRLSLTALSNPANYRIGVISNTEFNFAVGTEFSYRLTGTNLFSLGAPGSTITSLRVTFGSTTFEVSGLNLDFAALYTGILSGSAGGFASFLAGDDTVLGGDLADDISDLVGHNNLFGGAGADTLTSGTGNDHLYGQSASGGTDAGDTISAGAGSDYVNGNAGNDTISGGDGSDRIQGGQDNDQISGDAGNDTLNGNRGNDMVLGGAGNDSLRGGQDNDTLSGGAGNDALSGDLGVDQLTGGDGVDRFIFGAGGSTIGSSVDTVTDFQQGTDLIQLGFVPASVLVGSSTAASIDAARSAAQALFDGNAGNQEAAAINLSGGSTLIFWSSTGGATIDSVAAFQNQLAADFARADFV
ncbi:calcium-binding protein [Rhizorhabdus dicambivorans]|uniref:Hemolysin-type calcium-binding protein n=1 Tax=Rhizorhabdus dicambivorans TaxID=1850238 RepID=A0A2A4G104_9SPHN|nr:calcium-binding protein [Rhizorhabdus dicambivorans]ATE63470.1 hemolysin-type calcium-binding protein [Rhizorhabdus dicambivorans]PCE43689.1 hemolysin-type calcium-binding protein [Rhizorhabdus dicambivorans]